MFLVFRNHEFNNISFDSLGNSDCCNISVYFISNGAYSFKRLKHLFFIQSQGFAIIFDSNPIIGFSESFPKSKLHLRGKMVESVFRRFDQFQFIFNVALIILFLKRSYDFLTGLLVRSRVLWVGEIYETLQIHLVVLGSWQTTMQLYYQRNLEFVLFRTWLWFRLLFIFLCFHSVLPLLFVNRKWLDVPIFAIPI